MIYFISSYLARTPAYQPTTIHCQIEHTYELIPDILLLPVVRCTPLTSAQRYLDAKYIQYSSSSSSLTKKMEMKHSDGSIESTLHSSSLCQEFCHRGGQIVSSIELCPSDCLIFHSCKLF